MTAPKLDPTKRRTPNANQRPPALPGTRPHRKRGQPVSITPPSRTGADTDATPQPTLPDSGLKRKLLERRAAERKAAQEAGA